MKPKPRLTPPAGSRDITARYGGVVFIGSPEGERRLSGPSSPSPNGSPNEVVGSSNEVVLLPTHLPTHLKNLVTNGNLVTNRNLTNY
jgi:hypothetical protein